MVLVFGVILFVVMLLMGVPIAYGMLSTTLFGMAFLPNVELITVTQRMLSGLNSFTLLAVPMFIMAANLIFHVLSSSRKPTVAAVNGYALGGGMELALACDFRVGTEKTQFSAPEYGLGWVPGWGGVHRLGKLVGQAKAKEILLLKRKIRGPEALNMGLLTELVENPEELVDRALEMAEGLAELNPLTVTYTKTILNDFDVPACDSLVQGLTNGVTSKSPYARQRVEEFFNRKK